MNRSIICLIKCFILCQITITGAEKSSSNGDIKYGVSISGHTILSLDKFGMKTWANECKRTTRCKSIDFDRKKFVCELKSKSLKEAHADILQNPWTWHMDMENLIPDVSTCTNKVCKTDEKCRSGMCVFSECPSFPSIENAYLLPSTTRTCGPTRTYQCFDGSIESGNPNITLSFNVWTPTTFKCHCPGLPSVKNANLLPSITRSCGPTRTFQCSDGFIGSGNPNIKLSFNVWTPTTFKCHKTFGDWILLARFKSGIGISAYDTWLSSGTSSEVDTSVEEGCTSMNYAAICTKHYRSGVIDEWYTLGITEVRVEMFSQGTLVAYVYFNGKGSSSTTWFSPGSYISSKWTYMHIKRLDFSVFQEIVASVTLASYGVTLKLESFFLPSNGQRRFFIQKSYESCSTDYGWMLVAERPGCPYEHGPNIPQFTYSPGNTFSNCANFQVADVMAISVKANKFP